MAHTNSLEEKLACLKDALAAYGRVAVAFSGGVDSTFLLAVAHEVLGDGACAITAQSPAFPAREHDEAVAFCAERGIRQIVFDARHFDIEGFAENTPDRCYLCKRTLFATMASRAAEEDLGALVDGSNVDDTSDYRPGARALAELDVESPLLNCGFSKEEIRGASAAMGLSTADKSSFACLATRFPYGQHITPEGLARVDAAESAILDLGVRTVRVRSIGNDARIEVAPEDFDIVLGAREQVVESLKTAGFGAISLDLQGYRTGSMNEAL